MILVENSCTDPEKNLSFEKSLMEKSSKKFFMLWRNKPSVIIGKFGKIEDEINLDFARANEIQIVKRNSGGGAVYHDLGNVKYFLDKLKNFDDVMLTGKKEMKDRVAVFSFNVKDFDNGILADELSLKGFETRPGLHCSPIAHKTLGTFPQGALRVSPGFFNKKEEIDKFFEELVSIIKK